MELKTLKWYCTCGSSFIKIIWKQFSLKMTATLRVNNQAVFSAEIIIKKDAESEKIVEAMVELLTLFIAFCLLYIITYISYTLYACQTILPCTQIHERVRQ